MSWCCCVRDEAELMFLLHPQIEQRKVSKHQSVLHHRDYDNSYFLSLYSYTVNVMERLRMKQRISGDKQSPVCLLLKLIKQKNIHLLLEKAKTIRHLF